MTQLFLFYYTDCCRILMFLIPAFQTVQGLLHEF